MTSVVLFRDNPSTSFMTRSANALVLFCMSEAFISFSIRNPNSAIRNWLSPLLCTRFECCLVSLCQPQMQVLGWFDHQQPPLNTKIHGAHQVLMWILGQKTKPRQGYTPRSGARAQVSSPA